MWANSVSAASSLPAFTLSLKNGVYERGTVIPAEFGARCTNRHACPLGDLPTMITDVSYEADVSLDAADPENG